MDGMIPWLIAGFSAAILLCMWHWMVWRELDAQRQVLEQLSRQAALSRRTAKQAKDGPYAESTRRAMETSISVYGGAAQKYEKLRKSPCCNIPARLMGFQPAPELEDEE